MALLASLWLHPWAELRADGGTVRLSERRGDYRITVFTSPTPLRAGPVDVSVLVQDAAGEPVPGARVRVRLTPRGQPEGAIQQPATAEAATNKLFQAAVFDLPRVGWWVADITVEGLPEPLEARFALEVDEPLPRVGELWPWVGWPALAVVLFLAHQGLVRRRRG
jgi:hypothetical protein